MFQLNGAKPEEPKTRREAADALTGEPFSIDYRPQRHAWMDAFESGGRFPGVGAMLMDVERMVSYPDVKLPYGYFKSGVSNVKFKVTAATAEQEAFVTSTLERMWRNDLPAYQLSYDYGWCGYEVLYAERGGKLHYDTVVQLHPLDCWALTVRGRYVGLSVSGSVGGLSVGRVDRSLWGPGHWPAKGLWLVHNRRWDRFYGLSQLYPAWMPYRRLAGRNGAVEVIDGGIYRLAYQGPIVRFPPDDFRRAGSGDEDRDPARDEARRMHEQIKSGAGYALPNTRDQNGNYKWDITFPSQQGVLNVEPLLSYEKHLKDQIARAIGVPPELIEAGESGSGWSGRKIPLLGFYEGQVLIARDIVRSLKRQVLLPLLRWNFGDKADCDVLVELDLPAAVSGEQQQPAQPGQQAPMPPVPGSAETKAQQGQVTGEQESVAGLVEALNDADEATLSTEGAEHKYACAMLGLPEPLRSQVRSLAGRVCPSDLAEDGVEGDPHLTLLYGLLDDDAEGPLAVASALGPASVVLGPVGVFEKGDCDVVHVEVLGEHPHLMHAALRCLPHRLTHPEYRPHVTLAYVKKGLGRKYAGRHKLMGRPYVLDDFVFADRKGNRRNVALGARELSAVKDENWEPHRIEHGPRRGEQGWKNRVTGHIVVGKRPGEAQAVAGTALQEGGRPAPSLKGGEPGAGGTFRRRKAQPHR